MEEYLQQQADQGWKLRWCRGMLAGFGPREEETLRYAVDPHAATGLSYLRRYPKRRLQERMKEGWFSAGSSRGCQILCARLQIVEIVLLVEVGIVLLRILCCRILCCLRLHHAFQFLGSCLATCCVLCFFLLVLFFRFFRGENPEFAVV